MVMVAGNILAVQSIAEADEVGRSGDVAQLLYSLHEVPGNEFQ